MGEQRIPSVRRSLLTTNEALYDGIKPWMINSVKGWLAPLIYRKSAATRTSSSTTRYNDNLIHQIELHGRLNLGAQADGLHLSTALFTLFLSDENYALDILQAAIELCTISVESNFYDLSSVSVKKVDELNEILRAGGSKWHVVVDGSKARMESRVNETTSAAYSSAISSSEDFAPLLKKSWEYCYGRNPSPSEAYTFAIKAVESAAWRVITPSNPKSTLGTIYRDYEAQSQAGKFETIFHDNNAEHTHLTVMSAMQRLWESQTDRHATGSYTEPTAQESESAVHLAILVCHFFSQGAVRRKTL